ncbi:hypothetical protein ACE6H2_016809 [Prunus campanulata]
MRATSESAEWIFLATNLGLEMLSAACDQASSPRRPHFALCGMLLAIAAMLISTGELIYRGKKERVVFRSWGMLGWFYHPPSLYKPFGTLPDIFGLVAGISQCICSMVQYVYCLRHADNPFKVSLLPAIFLVCLGASKLINNRINPNTTDNEDSRENSSSTVETLWHAIPANIPSIDDHEVEGNVEQQWLHEEQQQEEQWRHQKLQQWQQWLQEQRRQQEQEKQCLQEQEKEQEQQWLQEQEQEQEQEWRQELEQAQRRQQELQQWQQLRQHEREQEWLQELEQAQRRLQERQHEQEQAQRRQQERQHEQEQEWRQEWLQELGQAQRRQQELEQWKWVQEPELEPVQEQEQPQQLRQRRVVKTE